MRTRILFSALTLVLAALAHSQEAMAACSSVRILEGMWDRTELDVDDVLDLVDPGPSQKQVVADAMGYLAPLQCHGMSRIAFRDSDGSAGITMGWVGSLKPDLLNIAATSSKASERNLSSPPQPASISRQARAAVVDTIVHESSHAGTFLLKQVAPRTEWATLEENLVSQKWSSEALAYAEDAVERNLLDRGLEPEWADLHQRAVDLGLANDYHRNGDPEMTEDQIIKMAVATSYGGDGPWEDIAEMAAGIMATRVWSNFGATPPSPPDDLICARMRAAEGPGIPKELALIYTKVGLLNSVGLIGDLEYDNCVGNLRVRADGNGFFTLRDDQRENSYTSDVKGTIGTKNSSGAWVFQMQARGQVGMTDQGDKPARIEITIPLAAAGEPRPTFPRGLYQVGHGGATVNIYYTEDGEEKLGVSVESGLVMVSRASTKLVEGSVFVYRFVNWTSLLPWPEGAGDTVITFRKKN